MTIKININMTVIACYNVKFYFMDLSFICIEINTSLRLLSTEIKIEKKVASLLGNRNMFSKKKKDIELKVSPSILMSLNSWFIVIYCILL